MSTPVGDTESAAGRIAAFVDELEYDDLPGDAVETVVRAFVDTVGVAAAGTRTPAGNTVSNARTRDDPDADGAAVDWAAVDDALAFGTVAHALDYDDLSWGMDGHPSVVLVPPILALAARRDVDGREAITAFVAGFEAACAIATPISPEHYERGWHATSTFGTFGATAAAASLLDLGADRTAAALNVAASMPAGLKRNFGTTTKPLHAGLASRSGVTAALLAAEGQTADPGAIDGDGGFLDLYGDGTWEPPEIGGELAIRTRGVHVKMYPCCYFTHSSIAAAASLAEANDVEPSDVESVSVTAARGAADALQHRRPTDGLQAKFSMEYTVASAIVRDRVGLGAFEDDAVADSAVESVRERVEFSADPALPYDAHEATVRIETTGGAFETTRADPPGVHSNPPSPSELREKFFECATRVLSESTAEALYDDLTGLPEVDSMAPIAAVLRP